MTLDLTHFKYRLFLEQRRMLIVGVGLIVVGFLLVFLVGLPSFFGIFESYERLQSEQALLDTLQQKVAQLQELSSVPGFEHKDQIDQLLPNEKPVVPFLSGVSQIVSSMNMPVSNMKITPGRLSERSVGMSGGSAANVSPADKATEGQVMLVFDTSGPIKQLYELIDKIEKSAPMSVVSQVRLTKKIAPVGSTDQSSVSDLTNPAPTDMGVVLNATIEVTGNYFVGKPVVSQDEVAALPGGKERIFIDQLPQFIFPLTAFPSLPGGSTLEFGDIDELMPSAAPVNN